MDKFTKIVPKVFRPYIGHHERLLACKKCVFKEFLKEFFNVFYTITKLRKRTVG